MPEADRWQRAADAARRTRMVFGGVMTSFRIKSRIVSVAALSFCAGGMIGTLVAQPSSTEAIIAIDDLPVVNDLPGETVRGLEGRQYGFDSLSFAVTHTLPGSGAPLHHHRTEEAHFVLDGDLEYLIGERRLVGKGPFIVRIPANVPHSFRNIGPEPVTVVGIFPRSAIEDIDP